MKKAKSSVKKQSTAKEPAKKKRMKSQKKSAKKENAKKVERRLTNIKLTWEEERALKRNAKRYTGGNLSEWLRIAGMMYVPPSKGKAA